jgi:lipopolysaccharide transport system ATP-binding protein
MRAAKLASKAPPPVTNESQLIAVDVRGLSKRYRLSSGATDLSPTGSAKKPKKAGRDFWALKDVSFTLNRGERLAIIGHNGAGKSTLLKLLSRVINPTSGEAFLHGRATSLLEVGTGFNPNLSGRQNIYMNAALHGMSRAEIDTKMKAIIDFSEIGQFVEEPVKTYSTGMRSRLGFSVAAHIDPDILMLDEVLSVGDASFQQKCLSRMDDLTGNGRTLIFVSHSMDSVSRFCDRAIWLDKGRVRADGDVMAVSAEYSKSTGVKSSIASGANRRKPDTTQPTKFLPAGAVGEAELISAKVVNSAHKTSTVGKLSDKVGIAFEYAVFAPAIYVPTIALYGPDSRLLFWSVPSKNILDNYRLAVGEYSATVWIPGNFLNVGRYSVSLGLVGPDHSPMERYFLSEKALSFQMIEPLDGAASARGILPRDFPGPLRPLSEWDMQRLDEHVALQTSSTQRA